jgi:hypothetical protein
MDAKQQMDGIKHNFHQSTHMKLIADNAGKLPLFLPYQGRDRPNRFFSEAPLLPFQKLLEIVWQTRQKKVIVLPGGFSPRPPFSRFARRAITGRV